MAGGIERQLLELLTHLDREKFDPYVVYLYGKRANYSEHFVNEIRKLNIPVVSLDLQLKPFDKIKAIENIIRLSWKFKPDIIHALNYHSNLLTRLSRPFLPHNTKLVGAVRNASTKKQLFYERISAWACSVIVCNSPHLRDQLTVDAKIRSDKVILIYNGVDIDRFSKNPDPSLRKRYARNEDKVFVCIGRISQQKAQTLLVKAFGELYLEGNLPVGTQCWLVGDVHEIEVANQLEAILEEYKLKSIVLRFSATHQPEAFYHASDVIILNSLWEGMPNVALEALSANQPVLISEAANAAGIIHHQINGWVVRTGDIEHLKEAIRELVKMPKDYFLPFSLECRKSVMQYSVK